MTTKFLDNKICTFIILLLRNFPRKKNSVLDDFPLCPQGLPPSKSENFIFIVVSPSLIENRGLYRVFVSRFLCKRGFRQV